MMVQLRHLCGARPQDIITLRPCEVITAGEAWYYCPQSHKTEHFNRDKVIVAVHRYRPLPRPAFGAEAAAGYQRAQRERDALVPEAYRRLKIGEFRVPEDSASWKERQPAILRAVLESLGDLPPRPAPPRARVISRELRRSGNMSDRAGQDE
jgi:hypothetical protein